jgi:hypothetical protein
LAEAVTGDLMNALDVIEDTWADDLVWNGGSVRRRGRRYCLTDPRPEVAR